MGDGVIERHHPARSDLLTAERQDLEQGKNLQLSLVVVGVPNHGLASPSLALPCGRHQPPYPNLGSTCSVNSTKDSWLTGAQSR